jgi:hypothetical protein
MLCLKFVEEKLDPGARNLRKKYAFQYIFFNFTTKMSVVDPD